MKQTITAKVKVTEESDPLDRTMEKYKKAIQYCVDKAWRKTLPFFPLTGLLGKNQFWESTSICI